MKYLLLIVLLVLFWLVWVLLPDRRPRWNGGYVPPKPASNPIAGQSASADDDEVVSAVAPSAADTAPPESAAEPLMAAPDTGVAGGEYASSEPDDLTRIKGIGKVLEGRLHDLGITTFLQIAQFTEEDVNRVNEVLSFKGRIERERWVEQAKDIVAKV